MSFLVVGLGNPGRKYQHTRHNTGYLIADALAREMGLSFAEKDSYLIAEGALEQAPLFILKPLTFMNLSGRAVSSFLRQRPPFDGRRVFVAYDDLDLPLGRFRLRWNGSGGGHKGVGSIIRETGTKEFYHVRVGIDRPPLKELVDGHVLGTFTPGERPFVRQGVATAVACITAVAARGGDAAMNEFNR